MCEAITLAHKAEAQGEVPVGAVVVMNGECFGEGWNQSICQCDPSAQSLIYPPRLSDSQKILADRYVALDIPWSRKGIHGFIAGTENHYGNPGYELRQPLGPGRFSC